MKTPKTIENDNLLQINNPIKNQARRYRTNEHRKLEK